MAREKKTKRETRGTKDVPVACRELSPKPGGYGEFGCFKVVAKYTGNPSTISHLLRNRSPVSQKPVLEASNLNVWKDCVEVCRHCKVVETLCCSEKRGEPLLPSYISTELSHRYLILKVYTLGQPLHIQVEDCFHTRGGLVIDASPGSI